MTSLVSRFVQAFNPRADLNPLDDRYYGEYGMPSLAGVTVSSESALRQSVFYRCVAIRANTFAQVPIGVYQRLEGLRVEIPDHPLAKALARPNRFQTRFSWARQMAHDWLVTGNAYSQIIYEPRLSFIPLDPSRTREVTKEGDAQRTYEFTRKTGAKVTLVGDRDIWHWSAMGGRGLIDVARDTLGIAISAERHAATFFRRGVKLSGVLEHPSRLKPDTASAIGTNFNAAFGGLDGHAKTPVLWEGMTYKPTAMTHQDAQFLETYKEGLAGIATFCGIPLFMVGQVEKQTSWGTGVEEQNRILIDYTMSPDFVYVEQDAERVFLDDESGTNTKYVKHNLSAFLRGRSSERAAFYQTMIGAHVMTPNEAREFEDWAPIEGGDEFPAVPGAQLGSPSKDTPDATPKPMKADTRAQELARAIAADLLAVEARDLLEIAKASASSADKWRTSVGAYFGRRRDAVRQSLSITEEQARAYCAEQARHAAEGGAAAVTTWAGTHSARVEALAIGQTFTAPDTTITTTWKGGAQ